MTTVTHSKKRQRPEDSIEPPSAKRPLLLSPIERLPIEILGMISNQLDKQSCLKLSVCSKALNRQVKMAALRVSIASIDLRHAGFYLSQFSPICTLVLGEDTIRAKQVIRALSRRRVANPVDAGGNRFDQNEFREFGGQNLAWKKLTIWNLHSEGGKFFPEEKIRVQELVYAHDFPESLIEPLFATFDRFDGLKRLTLAVDGSDFSYLNQMKLIPTLKHLTLRFPAGFFLHKLVPLEAEAKELVLEYVQVGDIPNFKFTGSYKPQRLTIRISPSSGLLPRRSGTIGLKSSWLTPLLARGDQTVSLPPGLKVDELTSLSIENGSNTRVTLDVNPVGSLSKLEHLFLGRSR